MRGGGGEYSVHQPTRFGVLNCTFLCVCFVFFFIVGQVDRAEEVPPPVMVVVMGPKGSGKTTLIRSLIKLYTGETHFRQGLMSAPRSCDRVG